MRSRFFAATLCVFVSGAHVLVGCGASPNTETQPGSKADDPSAGRPVADSDPSSDAATSTCASQARLPLRRLSNAEYRNTLSDLLGDREHVEQVTSGFSREPTALGFRNQATSLQVDDVMAEQFQLAAITFAGRLVRAHLYEVDSGCELDGLTAKCVQDFVTRVGMLVYRRPLNRQELVGFSNLYNTIIEQGSNRETALEWVVSAMLSSTHFLFRVEVETEEVPRDYIVASRLSYLLWQTMPDTELFAAAAQGRLHTRAQVREQVERMVRNDKAARVFEFFEQWLDVDELAELQRSEQVYPEYDAHLGELFHAETKSFVTHLLTSGGTFSELLTAEYTFANRSLAEHYGLPSLPAGDAFERVEAPGRSGILTQAPLFIHDHPYRTSIVRRGLTLRTGLLCQLIPAPPDSVDITLPELDGAMSQRQRLAQHVSDPSCSGCHSLVDPIGLVFEGFDALGRKRSRDEGGAPVLEGGGLSATRDADGEYASVRELGAALAQSDEARQCFVRQAFRFFYGRDTTADDECTLAELNAAFSERDFRLSDLILGFVDTDMFLGLDPHAQDVSPLEDAQ